MRYEVVITHTQPTCGHKSPTRNEIRSVETDDPIAYVRSQEKDLPESAELEIERGGDGTITVSFSSGVERARYEFSED